MSVAGIHAWNTASATVVGGLLNAVVLWVIACHTPKEMRPYSSRVLQQTAISDLLLLGLSELTQPVRRENLFF
jgi:hypothetical protein